MIYINLAEISRATHGRTCLLFTKNCTEFLNRMSNRQWQTKAYLGLKSLAEEASTFFSGSTPAKSRESLKYLLGCLFNINNTQVCFGFVVLVFLIECSKCPRTVFGGFISTGSQTMYILYLVFIQHFLLESRVLKYRGLLQKLRVLYTTVPAVYSVSPVISLCFYTLWSTKRYKRLSEWLSFNRTICLYNSDE